MKGTVTPDEEKGEISYVFKGHVVEHITTIFKNLYRHVNYCRNIW